MLPKPDNAPSDMVFPPGGDSAVDLVSVYGGDLMVANAARISYDRWSDELTDKDAALIRRLASEGHNSPFYHPKVTFRVTAPVYVARQLHRHQVGLDLNEVSRRYTSREIEFERTDRMMILEHQERSRALYEVLMKQGMHREDARAVLPLSLMTTWLWTGSLYAYANLCRQRIQPDAQRQTRAIAEAIAGHMASAFPVSWDALMRAINGNGYEDD